MPRVDAVVQCKVHDSFRVQQVAGLFDVTLEDKLSDSFSVEVPGLDEEWQIGVITGPSGSGKTTIAKKAYGDQLYEYGDWPVDKAVIDGFGDRSTKDVTHVLTAVGFSSPPSWVKPYAVLSNGERFRCELAKALLDGGEVVVFDEFTSVVDRVVAKIGSAAVSKAIRTGKVNRRFVAVTCHSDVHEWLEADWVVDMATSKLERGRLRRPEIVIDIFRCHHSAWSMFAKHHYLNRSLNRSAHCYLAMWDDTPVGFCAFLPLLSQKGVRRGHRMVVLPDYQGIGIAHRMVESLADMYKTAGVRVTVTAGHPAMIAHWRNSPLWRVTKVYKIGSKNVFVGDSGDRWKRRRVTSSVGRSVVSVEYVGVR